jgi:hypothetical protein
MPTIDEDTLRDLMHRSTSDLHASPAVTAGIVAGHRRRRNRNRVLGLAATGVAAGTAFGLVAYGAGPVAGGATPGGSATGLHHLPAIQLTAAQRTLYHLSSVAAKATQPPGRYVVLTETQGDIPSDGGTYQRTSVIDSQTGDTWTYQKGAGVPATLPVDRGGTTQAQFATWPTDPVALRALLLKQAKQQNAEALRIERAQLKKLPKTLQGKKRVLLQPQPVSDDSYVFEQATITLWNPLAGPALRSALFKVLATTRGMTVNSHATDSLGRPSIEISRTDNSEGEVTSVFEDPADSGVHELLSSWPAQGSEPASQTGDVFLSTTRTNTFPPDPYSNG